MVKKSRSIDILLGITTSINIERPSYYRLEYNWTSGRGRFSVTNKLFFVLAYRRRCIDHKTNQGVGVDRLEDRRLESTYNKEYIYKCRKILLLHLKIPNEDLDPIRYLSEQAEETRRLSISHSIIVSVEPRRSKCR